MFNTASIRTWGNVALVFLTSNVSLLGLVCRTRRRNVDRTLQASDGRIARTRTGIQSGRWTRNEQFSTSLVFFQTSKDDLNKDESEDLNALVQHVQQLQEHTSKVYGAKFLLNGQDTRSVRRETSWFNTRLLVRCWLNWPHRNMKRNKPMEDKITRIPLNCTSIQSLPPRLAILLHRLFK